MKFNRLLPAVLAVLLFPAFALAQQAILQGGPWTPNHAPMYVPNGYSQPIVQDSGPAGGGGNNLGLSELLLTQRSPTNTYPAQGTGTGPFGTNLCDYDAPLTNPTGYHFLCWGPNASTGGGLIAYGAAGSATPLPLSMSINGSTYQFPFAISGIVGPSTSTINHLAVWNNTTGTLLADGGALVFSNIGGVVQPSQGGLGTASLNGWVQCNGASPCTGSTNVSPLKFDLFTNNLASMTQTFDPGSVGVNNLRNLAIGIGAYTSGGAANLSTNHAVGYNAMHALTGGVGNVAFGDSAMANAINAQWNTALGGNALLCIGVGGNTTITYANVAIGHGAMASDDFTPAPCTGNGSNTAVGSWAGQEITTASGNALFGANAGSNLTTGAQNTFIGTNSGNGNNPATAAGNAASQNVAVGYNALFSNTASSQTAVGFWALKSLSCNSASGNTAIGLQALQSSTCDSNNTALGYNTLSTLNGGTQNIAIGPFALNLATTGSSNVAVGVQALSKNLSGTQNTAIGGQALFASLANANTALGYNAGLNLTTGGTNTAVGFSTLLAATTGVQNTAIGSNAYVTGNFSNSIAIGYQAQPTASNQVVFGNTAITQLVSSGEMILGSGVLSGPALSLQGSGGTCTLTPTSSTASFACSSDERLKKNIIDSPLALPWVNSFRIRDYDLKSTGGHLTGVVAQEVQKIHPEMVHSDNAGMLSVDGPNPWKMIKAIQELQAANDNLKTELRMVEGLGAVAILYLIWAQRRKAA